MVPIAEAFDVVWGEPSSPLKPGATLLEVAKSEQDLGLFRGPAVDHVSANGPRPWYHSRLTSFRKNATAAMGGGYRPEPVASAYPS